MFQAALPVIDPIIMLLLLALGGVILRRIHVLEDRVIKGITMILLLVAQPALMISATQQPCTPDTVNSFLLIMLVSLVFLSVMQPLVYLLYRRTGRDVRAVMATVSAMPNVGFIGIPIVSALYGDQGLLYVAAVILGFNFSQWTVGVAMFTGYTAKSFKNLLSPIFIAAAIGATLFFLNLELPSALSSTLKQLSALNTPMSMLLIGARLTALRPSQLTDRRLWMVVAIKLIAMPLLMLALIKPFGVTGMALGTLTLCMAMPSGANGQMLAERYGGDAEFAAKCISVTTLLIIVSLPLVLWVMAL